MSVISIGGGPHPQNVRVISDAKGIRIENEDGSLFASGFTDADDAHRYLAAIAADPQPVSGE